jgi:acetyl-CoA acetyltransferase
VAPKNSRVAVAGVGYSTIGRRTGLSAQQLTVQCVKAALEDSGLRAADIDGYSTLGGDSLVDAKMLGMEPLDFFFTGGMSPAYVHPALMAVAAINSGLAHTVMTTRIIMQQPSGAERLAGPSVPAGIGGDMQFMAPIGGGSPTQWAGMLTRRHMAQFGTTEDNFADHVVTQRYHASMNEDALFREPLTTEDYFASRYVAKPLRLLDCDYPCDSGSAIIYTTEERARDMRQQPVFVESYALSAISDLNFEILEDMAVTSPKHCADQLWARTDLRPKDIDCAQLYDGFTIITFQWLEGLGFCGPGEAKDLIKEGVTRLGGRLPVNTDGGACNVGRRHGANFCIEATRQLRGECDVRQVPDAKVAVWTNAVGPFGGVVLLTSE